MNKPIIGRIHSVETFGAVDGPGVRYVLFMQGCPLRCLYCHNPDSWDVHSGKEITSEEAADDIKKYMNFIKRGGVTISGGEPLLQSEFVEDLILRCKALGLHTAIDTSGAIPLEKSQKAIDASDLLLLDIKSLDDEVCKNLTGTSNSNTLKTLDYCEQTHKPVWIRHVIVPGITLKTDLLENLADFLKNYTCIENIEILPFHKMGEFKWQDMNLKYSLFDTPQPENDEIQKAKEIFLSRNLPIKLWTNERHDNMKKLISSIMAGMYIGIGATTYLVTDNKVAGSFFFCVGIFLVMNYYNMLYTKVVPFFTHKKYTVSDIGIAFGGNLIGGVLYSFLISQTRLSDKISDKVTDLMEVKINDSYLSIFIMSIFCAALVAYATFGEKIYPNNKGLSVLFTFLFIMAFVMCGFDHIVANIFYYSFYAIINGFTLKLIPSFLVVLLGNTVGGLVTGYLELYRTTECQSKSKA